MKYDKLAEKLRERGRDSNMLHTEAAEAIEDLVDKCPKWVSATERLPEECGRFIVLLKASEDETKRWAEWGLGDNADIILEMLYDADQKIWKTEYGAYNAILSVVNREHDSYVTHWMQLPAPPKEET